MCQFMHERRELLGGGLTRKQSNAAAIRSAARRRDVFRALDRDILCRGKPAKHIAIVAWISVHHSNLRKVLAVSLTDIKDASGAEACDVRRLLLVVLGVLRLAPHDGGKNHDAFLAFLHEATELVPRTETGDVAGIRLL